MSDQPVFDFTVPADTLWQPQGPAISRHCSYAGAVKGQAKTTGQLARVFAAIRQYQPVTDHELVTITGLPLNLVNARTGRLKQLGVIQREGSKPGPFGTPNSCWVTT